VDPAAVRAAKRSARATLVLFRVAGLMGAASNAEARSVDREPREVDEGARNRAHERAWQRLTRKVRGMKIAKRVFLSGIKTSRADVFSDRGSRRQFFKLL
jgi:hypothetical protein